MTIGDILGIVSALVGICISCWAMMVTCGLLFPAKAEMARSALVAKPKSTIAWGALLVAAPGFAGILMLSNPNPGVKLLGMAMVLAILGCAALGGAGISFIAGDQIQKMGPDLSDYAAFVRGAGFLGVAAIFPILGWFFFGPLALFAGVGSGAKSVLRSASMTRRHAEPIG